MRTLVIGGTGHLGAAVVRELVGAGWPVRVLTRGAWTPAAPHPALAGVDVTYQRGDGHDVGHLRRAICDVELVVDCAAPYPVHPATPDRPGDPVAAAVARTEALCAASHSAGALLVAIGSFVTHRTRQAQARTVVGRLRSRAIRRLHPYFAVKDAVEAVVTRAAARGQRAVALNPTGCLGPWDTKPRGLCLVPMVARGELPATTTDVVDFIDVRDVALAVRRIAQQARVVGPVLLSGHSLPFRAYFDEIARQSGLRAPRLAAPASLGVLALVGAERALAPLRQRPPWPSLSMVIVAECGAVQTSDAQRALGVSPRPVAETIADALAWYRSIGYC